MNPQPPDSIVYLISQDTASCLGKHSAGVTFLIASYFCEVRDVTSFQAPTNFSRNLTDLKLDALGWIEKVFFLERPLWALFFFFLWVEPHLHFLRPRSSHCCPQGSILEE